MSFVCHIARASGNTSEEHRAQRALPREPHTSRSKCSETLSASRAGSPRNALISLRRRLHRADQAPRRRRSRPAAGARARARRYCGHAGREWLSRPSGAHEGRAAQRGRRASRLLWDVETGGLGPRGLRRLSAKKPGRGRPGSDEPFVAGRMADRANAAPGPLVQRPGTRLCEAMCTALPGSGRRRALPNRAPTAGTALRLDELGANAHCRGPRGDERSRYDATRYDNHGARRLAAEWRGRNDGRFVDGSRRSAPRRRRGRIPSGSRNAA